MHIKTHYTPTTTHPTTNEHKAYLCKWWPNGTRCRDGVKALWCHSHLVWLVLRLSSLHALVFLQETFCDLWHNCSYSELYPRKSNSLVDNPLMKAEWRSVSMECGGQCVMVDGIVVMQQLCACRQLGFPGSVIISLVWANFLFYPSTLYHADFLFSASWLPAQLGTRDWPCISVVCRVYWNRVNSPELWSQWD